MTNWHCTQKSNQCKIKVNGLKLKRQIMLDNKRSRFKQQTQVIKNI